MSVSAYLNFKGNCREALEAYAKVFGSKPARLMTFGEGPADQGFPMDEATRNLVMHAELEAAGATLMFSDTPPGMPFAAGNSITLLVQSSRPEEVRRWYEGMKEGGQVRVELGPQSWSKLYGYVVDRFGVGWQFGLAE